jgi:serine/threonine-protein kinase RsbW
MKEIKMLRVEGTLQAIEPLVQFALQVAEEAGFDQREQFRVRLAVDELATNIVTHGYLEAGRRGDLTISAEVAPDQLTIYLEDNGAAYDPRQMPPPDLTQPPVTRPLGGLGIYLALWAVDKFQYEQDQAGNKSIIVVDRPCSDPSLSRCHPRV